MYNFFDAAMGTQAGSGVRTYRQGLTVAYTIKNMG
jgi:hypothetical protein